MNKKLFIVAIITLIVDQISKIVMEEMLALHNITIIKNFFRLTLVYNKGAAWGIFSGNKMLLIGITIIAVVIIFSLLKGFKKNTSITNKNAKEKARNSMAFGLLLGGLSGNLADRLLLGYVRDFLDFTIINYNYPVFNISDIAIVVSVILLIYAILKGEDSDGNTSKR